MIVTIIPPHFNQIMPTSASQHTYDLNLYQKLLTALSKSLVNTKINTSTPPSTVTKQRTTRICTSITSLLADSYSNRRHTKNQRSCFSANRQIEELNTDKHAPEDCNGNATHFDARKCACRTTMLSPSSLWGRASRMASTSIGVLMFTKAMPRGFLLSRSRIKSTFVTLP